MAAINGRLATHFLAKTDQLSYSRRMASLRKPHRNGVKTRSRSVLSRILRALVVAAVAFYSLVTLSLLMLRWANPLTTAVQTERRLEALMHQRTYRMDYVFVPIEQISPALQHAVVAAEDARFFQHHGFDWTAESMLMLAIADVELFTVTDATVMPAPKLPVVVP
jgi:membrane peptidoglycan carboxypeptidase